MAGGSQVQHRLLPIACAVRASSGSAFIPSSNAAWSLRHSTGSPNVAGSTPAASNSPFTSPSDISCASCATSLMLNSTPPNPYFFASARYSLSGGCPPMRCRIKTSNHLCTFPLGGGAACIEIADDFFEEIESIDS